MSFDENAKLVRKRLLQLQAENKDLKETLDKTTDLVVDYQDRMAKLENSRDELLDAVKYLYDGSRPWPGFIQDTIKKAEALKRNEQEH